MNLRFTIFSYILICFSFVATAQDISIHFQVNMNWQEELGNFDFDTESVDIAGTFNGWGAQLTQLSDADEDGIYEVTIGGFSEGQNIEFKFRQNGQWDGSEEFPGGGPNRSYTVQSGSNELFFWYNNEIDPSSGPLPGISSDNNRIYAGGVVNFFDASAGNITSRTWTFEGGSPSTSDLTNPKVLYSQPGSYDVTLTVSDGSETETLTLENYITIEERDLTEVEWWNNTVFYEIFVRSFYDSDGDGIGDFNGLTSQLDYLNDGDPNTTDDLGITGIWLMPIHTSPSYHGYDVTNYESINPDYGTFADFENFLEEAHARGIKVIIDFVLNHTSTSHSWFVNAQSGPFASKRNWYRWSNTNPGYNGPWGQPVWHNSSFGYYYGLFWDGMPDLNYDEPEVKAEIFDVADFWLTDIGIDGFRLDAVKYIVEEGQNLEDTQGTFEFFQDFRNHYKTSAPSSFSVGEAWTSTDKVRQYVENDGLDFCFDFDLAGNILNALNSGNATSLANQLQKVYNVYPHLQFGTFLSNHDQNRIMNTFGNSPNKVKTAASVYLTAPGIPFIYYGEEVGMNGEKPDEYIRRPMQWAPTSNGGFTTGSPWIALNSNYPTYNVETQSSAPNSILNWYKKLISIRNQEAALQEGTYHTVENNNTKVLSFVRKHEGETILVMINTSGSSAPNLNLDLQFADIPVQTHPVLEMVSSTLLNVNVTDENAINGLSLDPYETKIYKFGVTTNTSQIERTNTLKLFPNPSTNQLTLETNSPSALTNLPYDILDISGKVVQQGSIQLDNKRATINIETIPSGVFILKIGNEAFQEAIRFTKL